MTPGKMREGEREGVVAPVFRLKVGKNALASGQSIR